MEFKLENNQVIVFTNVDRFILQEEFTPPEVGEGEFVISFTKEEEIYQIIIDRYVGQEYFIFKKELRLYNYALDNNLVEFLGLNNLTIENPTKRFKVKYEEIPVC